MPHLMISPHRWRQRKEGDLEVVKCFYTSEVFWSLILEFYFKIVSIWVKIFHSTPSLLSSFCFEENIGGKNPSFWIDQNYLSVVFSFGSCLWDSRDTKFPYGQRLVGQGFLCCCLIPESWWREVLTRAADGGVVGLAVFCFCHRSLGMQKCERISPWGTLIVAVFLRELCHLMKQNFANVSVHQHIIKRAVQCAGFTGFTSTPCVTVQTNPVGKFLGEGRRVASVCVWELAWARVSLLSRRW